IDYNEEFNVYSKNLDTTEKVNSNEKITKEFQKDGYSKDDEIIEGIEETNVVDNNKTSNDLFDENNEVVKNSTKFVSSKQLEKANTEIDVEDSIKNNKSKNKTTNVLNSLKLKHYLLISVF